MQHLVPVPEDLRPWLEAAVVLRAPATLAQSEFPAMVSSMLVVRLAGQVACRGAPVPASAWISAATAATVYAHYGAVHAVGLVLAPAAAGALFDAARGQADTLRPMAELAGPAWARVEAAVRSAADDGARIAVLCDFIRGLVAPPSACEARRQEALALLRQAAAAPGDPDGPGDVGVGRLSARQFQRRFAAQWGMRPKQFQVIARLGGLLGQALADAPAAGGAGLALDQGYYDQSHMGRDVRRLAGRPLQALVQGTQAPLTAHWPLQVGVQSQQQLQQQPHRKPQPTAVVPQPVSSLAGRRR